MINIHLQSAEQQFICAAARRPAAAQKKWQPQNSRARGASTDSHGFSPDPATQARRFIELPRIAPLTL